MKTELLEYLQKKHIKTVHDLWAESKNFYSNKMIEMGGSYASWGDHITVRLKEERFNIYLNEL